MRKLIDDLTLIYDEKGRHVKSVYTGGNNDGLISEYEYDNNNNIIRKINRIGDNKDGEIIYTYNNGRLINMKSDYGNINVDYIYDDKGRKISQTHSDGCIIKYEYDENGNCIRIIAPHDVYEYNYDENGNCICSKSDANQNIYEYDENGNCIFAKSGNRETKYEYDNNNNIISENTKFINANGDIIKQEKVIYKYNEHGNCILTEGDKFKEETIYEYDENDRVIRITSFMTSYDE